MDIQVYHQQEFVIIPKIELLNRLKEYSSRYLFFTTSNYIVALISTQDIINKNGIDWNYRTIISFHDGKKIMLSPLYSATRVYLIEGDGKKEHLLYHKQQEIIKKSLNDKEEIIKKSLNDKEKKLIFLLKYYPIIKHITNSNQHYEYRKFSISSTQFQIIYLL